MAARTVFAKIAFWPGECYFSILRHFARLGSLANLKIVGGKSGKFGDCI